MIRIFACFFFFAPFFYTWTGLFRLEGNLTSPCLPVFYTLTWGPFITEKISRGLYKTRTPRVNGTENLRWPLIQPTASSSRGLSWPRSFGSGLFKPRLSLEVKVYVYKCTQTLSAASWSRERLLRMFCFHKLHLIHGFDWSLAKFSSKFPHKFHNSPTPILTEILI